MEIKLKGLSLNYKKEDTDIQLKVDEATFELDGLFSIDEDEILDILNEMGVEGGDFGETLSYGNGINKKEDEGFIKKNVMYDLNSMLGKPTTNTKPKGLFPIDQYFESSFDYCVWYVEDKNFLSNAFINVDDNAPIDFFVGVHFEGYNGKTALGFETQFAFESFMDEIQKKFMEHLPSNNVQLGIMVEPLTQIRKKAGDNVFGELKYTNTRV